MIDWKFEEIMRFSKRPLRVISIFTFTTPAEVFFITEGCSLTNSRRHVSFSQGFVDFPAASGH